MGIASSSDSKAWLAGPAIFAAGVAALLLTWAALSPETLIRNFDADGFSPFEIATLPFYAAIIPAVWLMCPFDGSRTRRTVLSLMVTVVAVMAILKQTDLHCAALHALYPNFVDEGGSLLPGLVKPNGSPLTGTPFKMRVITNGGVPLGMKAAILFYFAAFFGVFAAGFAYLLRTWVVGVFRLEPCAWSIGCFGASGVLVQLADRIPAWVHHSTGEKMATAEGAATSARSLCTALEEGGEMLIAIFALLAIFQAHRALVARAEREAPSA
jgi:hypothetical protein